MGTRSCDLQHDGAAGSATSKSSNFTRRFTALLAMCTTVMLVCLVATPLSAARPTSNLLHSASPEKFMWHEHDVQTMSYGEEVVEKTT